MGGGKVNEEDVKRSYKKPIAAPFHARAIRPVRHKLEAVTALLFLIGEMWVKGKSGYLG